MNQHFSARSLFPEVAAGHAQDGVESCFGTCSNVLKYLELGLFQEDRNVPVASVERNRDLLFAKIIEAIKSRKLVLDFVPVYADVVNIPAKCQDMYMQSVLYWCARFNATVPEVLESSARAGQDAPENTIRRTIAKIRFEDQSCQTNSFFPSR